MIAWTGLHGDEYSCHVFFLTHYALFTMPSSFSAFVGYNRRNINAMLSLSCASFIVLSPLRRFICVMGCTTCKICMA